MKNTNLVESLRFYFITDEEAIHIPIYDQVSIAIKAGATTIQYRNKNFSLSDYGDVLLLCSLCNKNRVMFIINDNVLLAKAVGADGVHLGQKDDDVLLARKILGPNIRIGLSISTIDELNRSNLKVCDYIGVGPVFNTKTKLDASLPHGLDVLNKIVKLSSHPVVAIGGINSINVKICMDQGVDGVAVISYITRSNDPARAASRIAKLCFD